ncbi:unnamed protein product, partial [Sphenostylis stenocarpa]
AWRRITDIRNINSSSTIEAPPHPALLKNEDIVCHRKDRHHLMKDTTYACHQI